MRGNGTWVIVSDRLSNDVSLITVAIKFHTIDGVELYVVTISIK